MMKKYIQILLIGLVGSLSAKANDFSHISGTWRGDLKIGAVAMPVVLNFNNDAEGRPAYTLDSPQQNVKGLPLTVNYMSADSVSVSVTRIGADFSGKICEDSIKGVFAQSGMRLPLLLTKEEPIESRRPQTPRAPFPYQTVDTAFVASDGARIAGTLVVPESQDRGNVPAVVMITGSGPQNRDEEMFEHRPFAVIADYLARNGIASFRYDDRGVGKSEGNFTSSTIHTFESDAEEAIKFIRGMNRFGRVGALGHSEGGTIAIMLGAREVPDFIISLAGMVISGKETILDQNRHLMESTGLSGREIDDNMKVIEAVFDEIIASGEDDAKNIDVERIAAAAGVTVSPMVMQSMKMNVSGLTPAFKELLSVNAAEMSGNVECPVLALNGELDTQVDARKNLSAISSGNKNAETHQLAGLNHLLQHAITGEVTEYSTIKETISPEVLKIIAGFIGGVKK